MAGTGSELMKLADLVDGFPVVGLPSDMIEVSGIAHDSRRVEKGDLFVGWIGEHFDGRVFSNEALNRGAVAVLGQGYAPENYKGPWLSTSSPRSLLALLAARLYDHPDRHMATVGVTGTNGKSTVTALLAGMLTRHGLACGTIGTLGYRFGDLEFDGGRTTPEGSDLFRALEQMRAAHARAVVMEISSHALRQGRVSGLSLDAAVFLNLSRDHFDFHNGFEDYFATKRKIFDQLTDRGRAVVNLDDPYGRRLADELPGAVSFGDGGDVRPVSVSFNSGGSSGELATPAGRLEFSTPLLGRFNLNNVLAAVATAVSLDVSLDSIQQALAAQRPLPGRMEAVGDGSQVPVFIDYAHTDAALSAALRALKEFTDRRIVLVFGCGGDRDPGKRLLMGRAAGRWADLPIITSDNPRTEDPLSIIAAVEEGVKQAGNDAYRVIPDRREAIRRAISVAGEDSVVLVAGKGHEETQILADRSIPFSDRAEVENALEALRGSKAG